MQRTLKDSLFFASSFPRKDRAILRIIKNYFRAVADAFPDLWEEQGNPLSKTIEYGALMRLLVDAFGEGTRRGDLSFDFFSELMTRARKNSAMDQDTPLTFESFSPTGSGESKLYGKLKEWSELA